jgi:outer membrane lipoprotein SlyB
VDRSDVRTEIEIRYAIVTNIEMVNLKSDVGKNAAIGGLVGLAIGAAAGGDVESAAIGAAAGSALSATTTKIDEGSSKAISYTLKRPDGSEFKVVTDDEHLQNGDCVAVETGQTTNLRRVSQAMCVPPLDHPVEKEVAAQHHEDAAECAQAKQQLLKAETDEDLIAATKKVHVLCQY